MKTSQAGIDLVKKWETLALESYLCPANVWTIGYGHTGRDVGPDMTCTKEEAEQWLAEDLNEAEHAIDQLVDVELEQCQFDALVSFVFNCGIGAFRMSTLLKLLNNGDFYGAKLQFARWNKGGGHVLQGLVNRRADEMEMFGEARSYP